MYVESLLFGYGRNGPISAHTGPMDKSRVPKEAQDDALSNGMSGGHPTPPGRPTGDDAAPRVIFFCVLFGAES
jgi:hypothetical protein